MSHTRTTTFSITQWIGRRRERVSIQELSETTLIERAGPGRDEVAFRELVRRHESRVRALLLRLSGNSVLADDLAQEVFLRAYRGLESFEGRAKLSTWLYRIAYNVFLNHSTRSRELSPLPDSYDHQDEARVTRLDPASADLRRDLDEAIARLPERYRSVLVLFYLEEISYPEIAEVLDLPLGTVKTHLHRAKKMLRQHMEAWA